MLLTDIFNVGEVINALELTQKLPNTSICKYLICRLRNNNWGKEYFFYKLFKSKKSLRNIFFDIRKNLIYLKNSYFNFFY